MTYDDYDYQAEEDRYMAQDDADQYLEPGICESCNGSGEGQFDDTTCYKCKGKGEV